MAVSRRSYVAHGRKGAEALLRLYDRREYASGTAIINAIVDAEAEVARLREALTLIRDTDPVDAILDPDRARRVAKEALDG